MNNPLARLLTTIAHGLAESIQELSKGYHSLGFARTTEHAARRLADVDRIGLPHFEPSPTEVAARRLDGDVKPLGGGVSATFLGRSAGGARSVYKSGHLETLPGVFPDLPLRFGIPRGAGHLASQIWAYSTPSHPKAAQLRLPREDWWKKKTMDELRRLNDRYPKIQREQMAVLDYVIGNTDRHWGNYRTGRDGAIVAIDHGLSFPEAPDSRSGIRSDFVKEFRNIALSEEMMTKVEAVDLASGVCQLQP
ncbi:hypothetical protein [Nocardia sp. CC227C]|uniref:hypothetical protein n=1 Tax=Nocardia sp. CC227C TaxID=3044562 RepID=UPI00278BB7BD|nr:hypothetical protein [Nocardia sp. CC227C]